MPEIKIDPSELIKFGDKWKEHECLSRSPPYSSSQLGQLFDGAVGQALAVMLGNISIGTPSSKSLIPPETNCVEVGPVRVVGGVRPQNFDVGYRPDGLRFAFDSKTLNDTDSLRKNWQNMINDIATEATTVHTRFPHAIVAFMIILPEPCVPPQQRRDITEILERVTGRQSVLDSNHLAEAISLVFWNPNDGAIDLKVPNAASPLRIEKFSQQIEINYVTRYKGLPPHVHEEKSLGEKDS